EDGLPQITRALRRAGPNLPPIRIVVLGPLDAAAQAGELHHAIPDVSVTFTGHIAPAATLEILAAADIFTRLGETDGLPFAVMEPMDLGKPVIAAQAVGLPELVRHAETGFLVQPG